MKSWLDVVRRLSGLSDGHGKHDARRNARHDASHESVAAPEARHGQLVASGRRERELPLSQADVCRRLSGCRESVSRRPAKVGVREKSGSGEVRNPLGHVRERKLTRCQE